MTKSKIGDYITSPGFMETAEKGVADAIAELRENGIEPVFAKLEPPEVDGWKITFHPDGTITANKPEALAWALERFRPTAGGG